LRNGILDGGRTAKHSGYDRNTAPSAQAILREASEIARRQGKDQSYWADRVVVEIAGLQIRAGDFDGARATLENGRDQYRADEAQVALAEAMASNGDLKRALMALPHVEPNEEGGWRHDEDRIQLKYEEHLISSAT